MIGLFTALFIVGGGVFLSALIIFIINYSVHISMIKNEHINYDYADFKTFINEFNKSLEGECKIYNSGFRDSIFVDRYKYDTTHVINEKEELIPCKKVLDKHQTAYLHADIIKFVDKGMILYPLSYIRYRLWKKKFIRENINKTKRVKGLFNEDLKDKEK